MASVNHSAQGKRQREALRSKPLYLSVSLTTLFLVVFLIVGQGVAVCGERHVKSLRRLEQAISSLSKALDETKGQAWGKDELLASLSPPAKRTGFEMPDEKLRKVVRGHIDKIQYRYGGVSTETGMDCSAYVQMLARDVFHTQIPRTSREQARMEALSVPKGYWRPGDLLFFASGSHGKGKPGVDHVGMYVSNGQFVHCNKEKKGVSLEDLSSYGLPIVESIRLPVQ